MISCLTLRAAKLNNLFCPGSTISSLIKALKSTRPFNQVFHFCFLFFSFLFQFFGLLKAFFDYLLRFFGFLFISSILILFFLFRLVALTFSFITGGGSGFGGFISVLISTFVFSFWEDTLCFLSFFSNVIYFVYDLFIFSFSHLSIYIFFVVATFYNNNFVFFSDIICVRIFIVFNTIFVIISWYLFNDFIYNRVSSFYFVCFAYFYFSIKII